MKAVASKGSPIKHERVRAKTSNHLFIRPKEEDYDSLYYVLHSSGSVRMPRAKLRENRSRKIRFSPTRKTLERLLNAHKIRRLSGRDAVIVLLAAHSNLSFNKIGGHYGISRERVSNILEKFGYSRNKHS
ncbi:MAG: hypothetical protein V1835_02185 [Candidatus Micrarchaeota archaeon]